MELDKAFELAVIFARDDWMKVTQPCSARVEYQREPETSLDYLSVWLVRAGGYQDLVCDYWTRSSSAHPTGVGFRNRHHSDRLAQTLDFVMKNQDQFSPCLPSWPGSDRPPEDERAEAATWMRQVHDAPNFGEVGGLESHLQTQGRKANGRQNQNGDDSHRGGFLFARILTI